MNLALRSNRLHSFVLRSADLDPQPLLGLLDAEEQQVYRAFRDPSRARDYVLAHGLKRQVLAALCHRRPQDLRFTHDAHGKPGLAGIGPHFNLSHSQGWVALAVSADRHCGIDIESPGTTLITQALIHSTMSPAEQALIARAADPQRAFLDCWVSKEALLKARGTGLVADLSALCSLNPAPAADGCTETRVHHAHRDYALALCARGEPGWMPVIDPPQSVYQLWPLRIR
ncbi:4'-phosphopantetheinyl transferase superfamily protein [Pseudomonas putida]|uniref:4'-phosphopantetheinyl transferase family protein n=1 Tax=Pseudomonas putida TaxID=303 RepID=UPI002363B1DF|nr:4'-phosphopantetheinyl transferase superfamily protein [Pseudomonas putida]MDD2052495.1 4'-phosphopantetheinyl transferase superfamily protein [Pseudomonas putida]